MSVVSSLSLLAAGEACLVPWPSPSGVMAGFPGLLGGTPASLHPAFPRLILLIHVFLPFVKYGEKGRMNGQSLIGAAGDAPRGPLWKDPCGDEAGEAGLRGFAWLGMVRAHGPSDQVGSVHAAFVSGKAGTCAPSSGVVFPNGAWEVGSLCSAEGRGWGARSGVLVRKVTRRSTGVRRETIDLLRFGNSGKARKRASGVFILPCCYLFRASSPYFLLFS